MADEQTLGRVRGRDVTDFSWTQPVCTGCWIERNHDVVDGTMHIRVPVVVKQDYETPWADRLEECCFCGGGTTSGIFVRINPEDPDCRFPSKVKDE